jgi:hypothetical protein
MTDTAKLREEAMWLATHSYAPSPLDLTPANKAWDRHWDDFYDILTPTFVLNLLDVVEAAAALTRAPLDADDMHRLAGQLEFLRGALDRLTEGGSDA